MVKLDLQLPQVQRRLQAEQVARQRLCGPAASDERERPERYFDYDVRTQDVIPREDIVGDERQRAWDTIDDLGLNELDVRFYRQDWIRQIVEDIRRLPTEERTAFAEYLANQPNEFLGTTRMVLAQLREAGEVP